MQIKLYTNTAEPERVSKANYLTTLATINGTLKEQCSIEHPIITIDLRGTSLNVGACNYAYISAFGRYYYVNGRTYLTNDMLRLDMDEDYLMSHRSGILACQGYVVRQETYSDPALVDNNYAIAAGATITNSTFSGTPWEDYSTFFDDDNIGNHFQIVAEVIARAVNPLSIQRPNIYGITRLVLNRVGFEYLIKEASSALFQNLFEYIRTIYFIPTHGIHKTLVNSITLGPATTPHVFDFPSGSAFLLTDNPIKTDTWSIAIPSRSEDTYLNCAPYKRYQLQFMPFGSMDLNPDVLANALKTNLYVKCKTDLTTGAADLYYGVDNDIDKMYHVSSAKVGVDLTVGAVTNNLVPSITSAVGAGVSIATAAAGGGGVALAGAIASGAAGVGSSLTATGGAGTAGSQSSGLIDTLPRLITTTKRITGVSEDKYGKPLCQNYLLSLLQGTGYTKIDAIHLEGFSATEMEKREIDTLLKTGVIL